MATVPENQMCAQAKWPDGNQTVHLMRRRIFNTGFVFDASLWSRTVPGAAIVQRAAVVVCSGSGAPHTAQCVFRLYRGDGTLPGSHFSVAVLNLNE